MCCGLGEEERTKFRKKKKEKKRKNGKIKKKGKNLIAAKSGLILGWDKKASLDVQPRKIFFAVFQPFLTEIAFYVKLAGRFSTEAHKCKTQHLKHIITQNSIPQHKTRN